MTSDQLGAVAGVILSLACSRFPGLRDWFAALDGDRKRALMRGVLAIGALGAFLMNCAGILSGTAIQRSQNGAIDQFWTFIAALVANRAMFLVSPGLQKLDTERRLRELDASGEHVA